MSKIQVVYWSQTGNTQAMAEAVARGIEAAGKEAELVEVGAASLDDLKNASAKGTERSHEVRRELLAVV